MKSLKIVKTSTTDVPTLTGTRRWIFSFGLWTLIGLVVALVAFSGFQMKDAYAVPGIDLSKYDPDVRPLIDVGHVPPIIAGVSEKVDLEFDFACGYAVTPDIECRPTATLFVAYGSNAKFTSVKLQEINQDFSRVLKATVAASDENGQALQYYLEVNDSQAKINLRYPTDGAIQTALASQFVLIDLPAQQKSTVGELVAQMPWGSGAGQVGISKEKEQAPTGPDAFDVAANGEIALLDHVNKRIVLFNPHTKVFQSYAAKLNGYGDVAFSADGGLLIADLAGELMDAASQVRIPQLYQLGPGRQVVGHIGPIYGKDLVGLNQDSSVTDMASQFIKPVEAVGKSAARERQRTSQARPELLSRWLNDHQSRFIDTQSGLAIEIRFSESLGSILQFSRIDSGYVVAFESEGLRMLWLDKSGQVLGDLTVPNHQFSPFNPYGRIAVEPNGDVYYLGSTASGVEIYRLQIP